MIREPRFGNTRGSGIPGKRKSSNKGIEKQKKQAARERIYKKWRREKKPKP
jgi:hypothetical protein